MTDVATPPPSIDIEEIVDPRDTRKLLVDFAHTAAPLRGTGVYLHGIRG